MLRNVSSALSSGSIIGAAHRMRGSGGTLVSFVYGKLYPNTMSGGRYIQPKNRNPTLPIIIELVGMVCQDIPFIVKDLTLQVFWRANNYLTMQI